MRANTTAAQKKTSLGGLDLIGAVICAAVLLCGFVRSANAEATQATIEVRLVAKSGGFPFSYADGTTFQLERWAVLRTSDFSKTRARPTRNANYPGLYEVEVDHTERARASFVAVGERDRDRSYCVLIGSTIDHCAAFPPSQKAIYDRGQILMDRPAAEARRLAAGLNASISAMEKDRRSAETAARSSARALLDLLYRRAINERSPQWVEGEERDTFLSSELVSLWQKVDETQEAGNEDAVFTSDPIAATNAFTLKSYRIKIESKSASRVTALATLGYVESTPSKRVRYDLVREGGRWHIADIGEGEFSMKSALKAFVSAPPPAPNAP